MKRFEVVFFRHGIADASTPDRDRALTEEGVRKTWASAEGLKKMVCRVRSHSHQSLDACRPDRDNSF
jgi:phosphohistidine phosphatase SixA